VGVSIIRRACEEPCRQIATNAGKEGSIIVQGVRQGGHGYNAQTDKFEDLFESGVIDPTKVVRSALQNAASVASLLITTEAMVVEKAKEEKPAAGDHGGGGMGGMM
jgi:chaperonin GroEL